MAEVFRRGGQLDPSDDSQRRNRLPVLFFLFLKAVNFIGFVPL